MLLWKKITPKLSILKHTHLWFHTFYGSGIRYGHSDSWSQETAFISKFKWIRSPSNLTQCLSAGFYSLQAIDWNTQFPGYWPQAALSSLLVVLSITATMWEEWKNTRKMKIKVFYSWILGEITSLLPYSIYENQATGYNIHSGEGTPQQCKYEKALITESRYRRAPNASTLHRYQRGNIMNIWGNFIYFHFLLWSYIVLTEKLLGIKFLGINLPKEMKDLYTANYKT